MSEHKSDKVVVLVVDDEFLVRVVALDMLNEAGFETVEAVNGDEAIQILQTNPNISVLFTDINMPGSLDGLELARRVHVARPDMQIILTSGRIRPDASMTPPGGIFVEKPYISTDIIKLIRATTT